MRELALELLEFIDDVVDELRSRREVDYVRTILTDGTSADKQVQTFRETGDLRAVVRSLVDETRDAVEQSARTYHV
jgi:glutamate---cysteine ligase / carboxylate-amine ligase